MPDEDRLAHLGLISDDGKWRWDGNAWQPVETAVPPPLEAGQATPASELPAATILPQAATPAPSTAMPSAPKRRRRWISYVVVAVVCLIAGGVIGSASSSSNQQIANQSASSPAAATSPKPTSPAPSARSEAETYANVATPHLSALGAAASKMGTDCTNADLSACRSDAKAMSTEAQSFLDDIGKLTVPACLSATNLELGTALELYIDGDNDAIAGLDASDATQIEQGAQLITLGTTHLNKANDLLSASPCG